MTPALDHPAPLARQSAQGSGQDPGRITALDALRGLAALSVLGYHCLLVDPTFFAILGGDGRNVYDTGSYKILLLTASPPSLLWSGREAVLLFFVLSGFVLSLPFLSARPPRYAPFIVKRACRLILPSAAVILGIVLIAPLVGTEPRPELSFWFNQYTGWEAIDPLMVVRHLLLIGTEYPLNNVLWTLHYEWHASLLFPVVVAVSAAGIRVALPAMVAALAMVIAEAVAFGGRGYLSTLYFLVFFLFGSLVATQRGWMIAVVHWLPRAARVGLWVLAYLLLNVRWLLPEPENLFDLMTGAGAALLILLVLASPRAQAILSSWPLPWLGNISFALYLVHVPVIVALIRLMPESAPLPLTLLLAAGTSLALAALLRQGVELPSIRLGQALARQV